MSIIGSHRKIDASIYVYKFFSNLFHIIYGKTYTQIQCWQVTPSFITLSSDFSQVVAGSGSGWTLMLIFHMGPQSLVRHPPVALGHRLMVPNMMSPVRWPISLLSREALRDEHCLQLRAHSSCRDAAPKPCLSLSLIFTAWMLYLICSSFTV